LNPTDKAAEATSPFSCTYTPGIPGLLQEMNCSLAISTYQAGKLIFLSPQTQNNIIQITRSFAKPMGIAFTETDKNSLALACKEEIIVFANSPELGYHYPNKPSIYDSFYVPRMTYHTGPLDIHDLRWGNGNLFAVNTLFSCIVSFDSFYNFVPYWAPSFITKLLPEDRCHLNGMVMINGKPKFATAFGKYDTAQGWKEKVGSGGLLIDIEKNEIILENLPMPHSPRFYRGELYLLFSSTGELVKVNSSMGTYEIIAHINGFVRGMDFYKDYAFICLSKLRERSSSFGKLGISDTDSFAGISVIHLPTGTCVGEIKYQTSVEEIYDIQILPGKIRPNILNTIRPEYKAGISMPGNSFWAKSTET
jgi:uncharacterized protein (TIGR03032 family)